MDWTTNMLLLMGGFLLLLFFGIPVFYAFFLVNIVGMFAFMGGEAGLFQLITSMYESTTKFTLLPITLFILMGEIMFRSGIAGNMVDALDKWIGRLPGRLAILSVATGTLFATLSGASIGSTAMLGSVLLPKMEKSGYHRSMSLGPIMGSGGLSILIPPSGLAVILAIIAQVSVGNILIGIIVPGFILAGLYAVYVIIRCFLQPSMAPIDEMNKVSLTEKLILTLKYVAPLSLIIFLVVGTIFLGVATPTEAAALGTVGSFILAACYKSLTWKAVKEATESTVKISVMVLVLLAGGDAFSQILAFSGVSNGLSNYVLSLHISPSLIVAGMLAVLIVLGMFVNGAPLMMLTVPIFMPIIKVLGFDPIWFSVLVLLTVEMAQITPPYGILLFVMKGVAPEGVTIGEVINAAMPFLLMDLLLIAIIFAIPSVVLWLPGLM